MSDNIQVYIDGDNVSYKDVEDILTEIKSYGRILNARVYGDWSQQNMQNWLKTASKFGVVPIQCERISGKNSSDLKMCVDVMKDLYTIENVSLFYFVTTDSDFRHIIPEIKTLNKRAHCIGNGNANMSLQSICDKYTDISVIRTADLEVLPELDLVEPVSLEVPELEASPRMRKRLDSPDITSRKIDAGAAVSNGKKVNSPVASSKKMDSSPVTTSSKNAASDIDKVRKKIHREVDKLLEENGGVSFNLGSLKTTVLQKYNFDERNWGCSKMSSFIKKYFSSYYRIEQGQLFLIEH